MVRNILRSADDYERIVYAELLIPDTPNTFGDITTATSVREFAYQFAMQGYGIDVNHDNKDVSGGKLVVVESFIAREGDPTFIVGSWVVGMKILDDGIWNQVVSGELNGFSYEADCWMEAVTIQNLRNRTVTGQTEPDLQDGHTHTFAVVLNPLNQPISGSTGVTDGHSHIITSHSYTNATESHRHRYQVLTNGEQNENEIYA